VLVVSAINGHDEMSFVTSRPDAWLRFPWLLAIGASIGVTILTRAVVSALIDRELLVRARGIMALAVVVAGVMTVMLVQNSIGRVAMSGDRRK